MSLHVLVLAGGSGTRLWPLSREARPKHLLPLAAGGATLLRASVERVLGIGDSVRVVTAASQAEACAAELRDLIPSSALVAATSSSASPSRHRRGSRPPASPPGIS